VTVSLKEKQIYLACGATDMRKSIDALTLLVQANFEMDPYTDALFVFCNRSRNRIKILEWDGDGFWVHFKRLEKGRFTWPSDEGSDTMNLTDIELEILLGGTKLISKLKRRDIFNPAA
jgi:transposase